MKTKTKTKFFLNLETEDGELLERFPLSEYDLDKPVARAVLMDEVICEMANYESSKDEPAVEPPSDI